MQNNNIVNLLQRGSEGLVRPITTRIDKFKTTFIVLTIFISLLIVALIIASFFAGRAVGKKSSVQDT